MKKKTATPKNTSVQTYTLNWNTPAGRERSRDFDSRLEAEQFAANLLSKGKGEPQGLYLSITRAQAERRVRLMKSEGKRTWKKWGYRDNGPTDNAYYTAIWARTERDREYMRGFYEGARLAIKETA